MVSYRFDLYPRTDPKDGTLIRSFTQLQKAAYRAEANGTSTGQLAVRSTTDDGQAIDPLGLQYVRVIELPGGSVRGGFFLEKGKFAALSEDEDSLLTFSGAGTLSYLSRASMAPHTYISPIFEGQDPFDDTWRLYAQSTVFANGNYLGAMLWRVIYEATHFTPGTHRHADGETYTDTHDDDRPENPLPGLTMTFDAFEDSSGNAWTLSSGEFKAQVGENVLSVVKRLMEAGLYVELDPDTFELSAWEQDVHRAMLDATGSAWATDVVRFQSPTDPDDLSTGNIKDDASRNIEAHIKRSALWAGGSDVYGLSTSPSDIPWEGHYRAAVADTEALEGIAAVQLQAIAEAGDTLKLRLWMEDDPANGKYLPWDHVLLDQQVTVHTGTDQWEFDERTFPVAALTIELKPAGNWDCIVELGASYSVAASRQFQVQGAPAHSHLPNPELCPPAQPGTPEVLSGWEHWTWDAGAETMANPYVADDPFSNQSLNATTSSGDQPPFTGYVRPTTGTNSGDVEASPGIKYRIALTWARFLSPSVRWRVIFVNAAGASVGSVQLFNGNPPGNTAITSTVDAVAPANTARLRLVKDRASDGTGVAAYVGEVLIQTVDSDGTAGSNEGNGISPYAARCDHIHEGQEVPEHEHLIVPEHEHDLISTGWFTVTSYGAAGDGTTDDTAAINTAIAALNSAGGGVLYFPAGNYLVSAGLTSITVAATIMGDGLTSQVTCSSATANLFTLTVTGTIVRDLYLYNSATATAGAAIRTTVGGITNRYERLRIFNFWIGIDHEIGYDWSVSHCYFDGIRKYAIEVNNANPDSGDYTIHGNLFSTSASSDAAIRIVSGGGARITNNKVNGGSGVGYAWAVDYAWTAGSSVISLITGNSFENTRSGGVRMLFSGGSYKGIVIDANQFGFWSGSGQTPILMTGTGATVQYVLIDNIVALGSMATYVVTLTDIDNATVSKIEHDGFTGKLSATSCANLTDNTEGGGVTDHGALTGLADDDHTQYLNETRHDALAHGDTFTVDPGTPTYDDSGDGVGVTVTSQWGITSGGAPYFDPAGVTSGDEAALLYNPATGQYRLVRYE